jgi:hypothetical protein
VDFKANILSIECNKGLINHIRILSNGALNGKKLDGLIMIFISIYVMRKKNVVLLDLKIYKR